MGEGTLDPFQLDALEDPYELYGQLRRTDPMHHVEGMDLHVVSRHADVVEAARRKEDFSSHLTAIVRANATGHGNSELVVFDENSEVVDVLAIADPPDHTRQRKTVARTFREISLAEGWITALVEELLAPMLQRGSVDWASDFAAVLPVRVVARLLGLPDEDTPQLKQWSDDGVEMLSGVADTERLADCAASVFGFVTYLDQKLTSGDVGPPASVLSTLAECVGTGDLSQREAVSMALQLVSAGSDSTGNLIGSTARILAEQPELQSQVRGDLALVTPLLEEVARIESPFRGHFRVAKHDTELAGIPLAEGARLFLLWGSANRDPAVFERADEIVLDRENPRGHLGFGWGIHSCIGAPLARLEAGIAITRLMESTKWVRRTPGRPEPKHLPSMLVRRLSRIHLDLL